MHTNSKSSRKILYGVLATLLIVTYFSIPAKAYNPTSAPTVPVWMTESKGLVAHAAGSIEGRISTNSLDAVIHNYALGHRVFEMDFNLTSDGVMVAIHDWSSSGGAKSSREFLDTKIQGRYRPTTFRQIVEFMAINEDVYLITDTKSFEYTDSEITYQFQCIYDIAREAGEGVLERIVVQIYNQRMYHLINRIYRFPNIIYTLYATPPAEQHRVLPFMLEENITLITMPPERATDRYLEELRVAGITVCLHTINDIDEALYWMDKGVCGIYTDSILPGALP